MQMTQATETIHRLNSELGSSEARLKAEKDKNARLGIEQSTLRNQVSDLDAMLSQVRRDLDCRNEKSVTLEIVLSNG